MTERKSKTLAEMAAESNGETSGAKAAPCPRCGGRNTRAVGDGVRSCGKCGREFTVGK